MINILVEIKLHKEYIDEGKKLLKELGLQSAKEKGCLMYHVREVYDDPSTVILYEIFKDKDAQMFHKTTEHYIEILINKLPIMIQDKTVKFLL